ncbi:hypothetical protein PG993_011524 [Apiospora rasikravindrae]|uniref:Uncharacterized protein n=1 Tax=Apiospora rasikravindrae TaxID=990691 RepID=A0ABR1SEI6_9PEZI
MHRSCRELVQVQARRVVVAQGDAHVTRVVVVLHLLGDRLGVGVADLDGADGEGGVGLVREGLEAGQVDGVKLGDFGQLGQVDAGKDGCPGGGAQGAFNEVDAVEGDVAGCVTGQDDILVDNLAAVRPHRRVEIGLRVDGERVAMHRTVVRQRCAHK